MSTRSIHTSNAYPVYGCIEAGQVLVVGVVYTELLRGTRSEDEFQTLIRDLAPVWFKETTKEVWERAAEILVELQKRGSVIPFADAVIAAHALKGEHALFSADAHFRRVPVFTFMRLRPHD
ncbi:MAG: PIN domain-containing protein [Dehalococcoidia bacterium]|nr:PIN domain-containing protein [Dehalococcoidia bacterium]